MFIAATYSLVRCGNWVCPLRSNKCTTQIVTQLANLVRFIGKPCMILALLRKDTGIMWGWPLNGDQWNVLWFHSLDEGYGSQKILLIDGNQWKIEKNWTDQQIDVSSYPIKVGLIDSILFYPTTLEGRRGTTDEFATIPYILVLFSAALVELAKSIPVQSLILSSHLFFCLPLFVSFHCAL